MAKLSQRPLGNEEGQSKEEGRGHSSVAPGPSLGPQFCSGCTGVLKDHSREMAKRMLSPSAVLRPRGILNGSGLVYLA